MRVTNALFCFSIIATSLVHIGSAQADTYRYITKDDDGDAIFLDETTVVKSGAKVDYWILNIEGAYLQGKAARSAYYLTRQSINCELQTMRSTDMSVYDAAGKRLASDSTGSEEGSIEPGTIEQALHSALCTSEAPTNVSRSVADSPLKMVRGFRKAVLATKPVRK